MSEARSAESDRELVAELRKLIKGDICSQFDPDYSREVRKVWNARLYEKKPLLYVNVECQDDISETLEFCKRRKVAIEILEESYLELHSSYAFIIRAHNRLPPPQALLIESSNRCRRIFRDAQAVSTLAGKAQVSKLPAHP